MTGPTPARTRPPLAGGLLTSSLAGQVVIDGGPMTSTSVRVKALCGYVPHESRSTRIDEA